MNLERGFLCYFKSYDITNLLYRALLQHFLAYSNDIQQFNMIVRLVY